jgi:hypothetical protein
MYTIRYLLVIGLTLGSCAQLPLAYAQNFSEVNKVIFGFPEYDITQERFDKFEFSFAKIKFDRGPHAIVILAFVDNGIYEWAGKDNVKIFTKDGRVIKTSGLLTDFEIRSPKNIPEITSLNTSSKNNISRFLSAIDFRPSFLSGKEVEAAQEYYELIDLYQPDLFNATLRSRYSFHPESIERFGELINVQKIEQISSIDSIAWRERNYFYADERTGRVLKSSQKLHPRLARVHIEFFYKF